jgi:hypothetical protein
MGLNFLFKKKCKKLNKMNSTAVSYFHGFDTIKTVVPIN